MFTDRLRAVDNLCRGRAVDATDVVNRRIAEEHRVERRAARNAEDVCHLRHRASTHSLPSRSPYAIFDALSPVGMASTYTLPMTNCLWTAQKNTDPPVGSFGGGLVSREALKFTDAQNGDFTLKRGSKARNAGYQDDAYLASVGPIDLGKNPRVYEGDGPAKAIIDIGCYECQIPAPGLMMLVK